ncbi:MAG: TonB-dependent receptor [Deltaproteobacteria bacterium]|nr:TonB-dependent receptor [Deltaproteobacteria bacterium]
MSTLPLLSLALLVALAEGPPAPPDAIEGDILEIDGELYQVHGGKLYTLDDPALEDPTRTITVTGSRVDTKQKTTRTEVIDSAALRESGARTLAEVLEDQAGIQLNSSMGLGQEVQLDGLDGRHVLILVDGRPVNGRVNNRVDVGRLPVSAGSVERIEIVRGPMSALYGSEALGGVVNIVTKKPALSFGGEAEASWQLASGVSGFTAGLHGRGGAGPVALRLDVTGNHLPAIDRGGVEDVLDADGYVIGQNVLTTADGKADLPDRRQLGLHGEAALSLPGALEDTSVRATLDAAASQASARTSPDVPFRDRNTSDEVGAAVLVESDLGLGNLALDLRLDTFHHLFDKLAAGDAEEPPAFCGDVPWDAPCPAEPDVRTDARLLESRIELRGGAPLIADVPAVVELSFAGGAVLTRQQATRQNGDGEDTLPGGGERDQASLYAEVLWRPIEQLTVIPGARVDGYIPSVDDAGFALGPKLAARLDLPAGFALRASYGRGFRLPSFEERLLRFDHSELGYIVEGNPNLKPEKSHGVRGEVLWELFPEAKLSAESYLNALEDLIGESSAGNEDGVPVFSYENRARAYTSGVNVRATLGPFVGLGLDVSYQYLINAVDSSSCPSDNPWFCSPDEGAVSLPLRPAHSLDINARFRVEETGTVIFVRGDVMSERPLDVVSVAPASLVTTFGLRQSLFEHVEGTLSLANVFDAYHPIYGPKPGRALMVGLRAF